MMIKAALGVLAMASAASAQTCAAYDNGMTQFFGGAPDPAASTIFFVLFCTALVLFAYGGFLILQAGRSGSTSVIQGMHTSAITFGVTLVTFWVFGYAWSLGDNYQPDEDLNSPTKSYQWFIGDGGYFLQNINPCEYYVFAFQFATSALVVSIFNGAIAGRTKLAGYIGSAIFLTMWIYPTIVHWTSTASRHAWLRQGSIDDKDQGAGYFDFAGAGYIHCTAGAAALIGAKLVGPRSEKPKPSNSPLVALGTAIVLLGFFGLNSANVGAMSSTTNGVTFSLCVLNTFLGVAGSAFAVLLLQSREEYWNFAQLTNAMIAGAVSVSAGCNTVYPWAGFVIGIVGGIVYKTWSGIISKAGIDDASDAFAVHFGAGAWGLIAVTLFALDKTKSLNAYTYSNDGATYRMGGIFYDATDRVSWVRMGWNFFAFLLILLWTAVNMGVFLTVLKVMGMLRADDGTVAGAGGLDAKDHGMSAYETEGAPAAPAKDTSGGAAAEEGDGQGPVEVKTSQI